MKQDFNNSMDSLLRDYARRHTDDFSIERGVDDLNESLTGNHNMKHLDADELAAFAENALPGAARARYVAHLADCDVCRHLIIDLRGAEIIASEIATQRPPHDIQARPLWREKLAAFFALPALRYVAPALAASLLVASIVGIMTYRSRDKVILVASQQETQTKNITSDSATNEMQTAMNSNTATSSSVDRMTNSPYSSNTATTTTTTSNTTANSAATTRPTANANASITAKETHTNAATRNDSVRNDALPNSARSVAELARQPITRSEKSSDDAEASAPKRDTTAIAKLPPPPAATGNANMSANRAGVVTTQNEEVSVTSSQVAKAAKNSASDGASTPAPDSPFAEARAADRRRAPTATTAAKKALPVNGRTASAADAKDATPSRRINGRDFRRQGNRWIDTAYAASQSTTNVARGSEQYRALIADEPGIGKIAAQLDGEIIVVWKKRAYRIR